MAEKKLVANSSRNASGASGHAQLDADVEEHAEEGEQVRGLAHEQVVQQHVGHDQRDAGHEPATGLASAPASRSPR